MELGYETLWKACTAILLSLLVARLVSLIIYCSTPASEVREKGFKRASTVDHDHDDGGKHKKLLKSAIHGGDRLNKVRSSGSNKKKRVKFVEPAANFVEFRSLDDVSVKDIEVVPSDGGELVGIDCNTVDCGEFGASCFVGNRESEGKEGIKSRESEEVGKELVDQREERQKLVGFEGNEDRERGEVGGELGSGQNAADWSDKIVGCDGFDGGERIVDQKVEDGHDIGVVLGSDKVVDDQRKEEAKIASNVYEKERRVEEFASGENDVNGIDKIVECQGFEGGERITNQREEEAKTWSNMCKGEGIGGDFDGEGMLSDEEEWEGIERSELEKEFAQAKDFVELGNNEGRLAMAGDDVKMQLYGLQKVAMEGPCHEPQPMALKLFARAKWNAWQRLGNMSPEEAMEQYVDVLSKNVPEWTEHHSSVERKSKSSEEVCSLPDAHTSTSLDHQCGCANERTSELSDVTDVQLQ